MSESLITIRGRDGRDFFVRKNPAASELEAMTHTNMRLLLTEHDLYCWHVPEISHTDVSQQLGIDGVRVLLQTVVAANIEPIGVPSAFPWLFGSEDSEALDIDQRQAIVEKWLFDRLASICPQRFNVVWYI